MMLTFDEESLQIARQAVEVGASDHPLDPDVVKSMMDKLDAAKPGEGFDLTPQELHAFDGCFQVGGEGAEGMTDALWQQILGAIEAQSRYVRLGTLMEQAP